MCFIFGTILSTLASVCVWGCVGLGCVCALYWVCVVGGEGEYVCVVFCRACIFVLVLFCSLLLLLHVKNTKQFPSVERLYRANSFNHSLYVIV